MSYWPGASFFSAGLPSRTSRSAVVHRGVAVDAAATPPPDPPAGATATGAAAGAGAVPHAASANAPAAVPIPIRMRFTWIPSPNSVADRRDLDGVALHGRPRGPRDAHRL